MVKKLSEFDRMTEQFERAERQYENRIAPMGKEQGDLSTKDVRDTMVNKKANARKRALKTLTNRAADIKKLNKSDIKQVRSLANKAASDYKAPEVKNLIQDTEKKTSATSGLLKIVARGAGLFGAGVMVGELVRVHNQIKKNPDTRYGSTSLFKVLTK